MNLHQINLNGMIQNKSLSFTTDYCDDKAEAEDSPVHSSGEHNCVEAGDDTEGAGNIHKT